MLCVVYNQQSSSVTVAESESYLVRSHSWTSSFHLIDSVVNFEFPHDQLILPDGRLGKSIIIQNSFRYCHRVHILTLVFSIFLSSHSPHICLLSYNLTCYNLYIISVSEPVMLSLCVIVARLNCVWVHLCDLPCFPLALGSLAWFSTVFPWTLASVVCFQCRCSSTLAIAKKFPHLAPI